LENQLTSSGGFIVSVLDSSATASYSEITFQNVATLSSLADYDYLAIQEVDGLENIDIIGAGAGNVLWIPLVAPLVPLDPLTLFERSGLADVMAIGDLNGDGVNDIVVADFNTIDVYFGTTAPTDTPTNPPAIPTLSPVAPTVTAPTPAPVASNPDPTTGPPSMTVPTTSGTTDSPTQEGPEPTEVVPPCEPETTIGFLPPLVMEGATVSIIPSETSDAAFHELVVVFVRNFCERKKPLACDV
jgi:hypothetical protein